MKRLVVRFETTAAKGDAWWDGLTREQQQEYVKAHPKSKYAKKPIKPEEKGKKVKAEKPKKTEAPKKEEAPKETPKEKKKKQLSHLPNASDSKALAKIKAEIAKLRENRTKLIGDYKGSAKGKAKDKIKKTILGINEKIKGLKVKANAQIKAEKQNRK